MTIWGGRDVISHRKVLCCHLVSENKASTTCICSSAGQFLIYSTFVLVLYIYLQDAGNLTDVEFMAEVGKLLRDVDFPTKSEIIAALSDLFASHTVPHDAVRDAIYSVLRGSDGTSPPDYTRVDDEQFVWAALPLLFTIAEHDKVFLVELMAVYVEGGEAVRYVLAA